MTMTDWTYVMYYSMDAISVGVIPLYIAMVIFGSFFLINLALAVLYLQFCRDKKEHPQADDGGASESATDFGTDDEGHSHIELAEEKAGEDAGGGDEEAPQGVVGYAMAGVTNVTTAVTGFVRTGERMLKDRSRWRRFRRSCYRLQAAEWFEMLCIGVIAINAVIMALQW